MTDILRTYCLGAMVCSFLIIMPYYGTKLGDRKVPYEREFGFAMPANPSECDLPPGPTPDKIHVGDCVRTEWVRKHYKDCDVSPRDPFVRRQITDSSNSTIRLPLVKSQFVGGAMANKPPMTKTFVQPPVSLGPIKYTAEVCYACPLTGPLVGGIINPMHLIKPVCVNDNWIEYDVEQ